MKIYRTGRGTKKGDATTYGNRERRRIGGGKDYEQEMDTGKR